MNQHNLAQKQQQVAAAEKAKQEAEDFKVFTAVDHLKNTTSLPWSKQLGEEMPKAYDQLAAVAQDRGLNRYQELNRYKQLESNYTSAVSLSNEVEQKVNALRSTASGVKLQQGGR